MSPKEIEPQIDFLDTNSFEKWLLQPQAARTELETKTRDGLELHINHPDKLNKFLEERTQKDVLFVVSGTSESGKSHMGQKFFEEGRGHRIKFVHAVSRYQDSQALGDNPDPLDYISSLTDSEQQQNLMAHVSTQIHQLMSDSQLPVGVVETIKHPWVVKLFEEDDSFATLSLFIDAPLTARVMREATRIGTGTDEMLGAVLNKDAQKKKYGNLEVAQNATLYINNAGSLLSYNNFLVSLSQIALKGSPMIGHSVFYSQDY